MESDIPWTPRMDEKVLEMFYTASPDRWDYQNRMKDMWDKKFPQFKDRISGQELRLHATNLIKKISHYRKNLPPPWTPRLIRKLVELYYRTNPQQVKHENRLKDAWDKEFPGLKDEIDKRNLRIHAKNFINKLYVTRRRRGKYFEWTPDINKEVVKIYHETSPQEQKHGERMKNLWDKTFPQYKNDITSAGLQLHAQRLIDEPSKVEKKYHTRKTDIDWTPDRKAEALHIFNRTDPKYKKHTNRIYECWAKMNPELEHVGNKLLKIQTLMLRRAHYEPTEEEKERARIKFDRAFPSGYIVKGKEIPTHKGEETKINWTPDLKKQLLRIFYMTSSDEADREKRMKAMWDRKYPEHKDKITDEELRQYAINLNQKLIHQEIADLPHLTPELKEKVLRLYFQNEVRGKNCGKEMRKMWDQEFPHFTAEANNLNLHEYAKTLFWNLKERKRDRKRNFPWTSSIDKAVMEMYHSIPVNSERHSERMKTLWDQRFPQYKDNVTAGSLRLRTITLLKEKKDFKERPSPEWDNELNADLLHVYHETEPKKRSNSIRMHKCWTQLHPEMEHITPKRLSNRLSHLDMMGFEPSDEERKKAKIKFDKAFPHGFKYKGKEIAKDTDESTTSYSVRHLEPEIGQSHPIDLIHQPELESTLFNRDDPIYSPVRHQEFLNDFDMYHQIGSSSQWSQHVPNMEDYSTFFNKYGNSSWSHDQHHPD